MNLSKLRITFFTALATLGMAACVGTIGDDGTEVEALNEVDQAVASCWEMAVDSPMTSGDFAMNSNLAAAQTEAHEVATTRAKERCAKELDKKCGAAQCTLSAASVHYGGPSCETLHVAIWNPPLDDQPNGEGTICHFVPKPGTGTGDPPVTTKDLVPDPDPQRGCHFYPGITQQQYAVEASCTLHCNGTCTDAPPASSSDDNVLIDPEGLAEGESFGGLPGAD